MKRALCFCAAISSALQFLNISYILGLECISVSLSNAAFQLQTVFTIGLSSCLLKDEVVLSTKLGVFLSALGVAMVVLPPLFQNENVLSSAQQCFSKSKPVPSGVLATIFSAAIGAGYLVSWRVLYEKRNEVKSEPIRPLAGFIDTHITLCLIGLCNLLLCWPILFALDWLGFETIQFPPTLGHWWILHWNGLIEYAFDVSCAAAIYMTSPVVTAVVAPLNIPLALVVDDLINGTKESSHKKFQGWMWVGSSILLAGIVVLETKPNVSKFCGNRHDKEVDREETAKLVRIKSNQSAYVHMYTMHMNGET